MVIDNIYELILAVVILFLIAPNTKVKALIEMIGIERLVKWLKKL